MSVPPFIIALFDMGPQVVALAHHVSVPDWNEEIGRFQRTGLLPTIVEPGGPAFIPAYVTPPGMSSDTYGASEKDLGLYVVKLSYESFTSS